MPENTVSVARPGKFGNPFIIGDFGIPDAASAVQRFREWWQGRVVGPDLPSIESLRGKNLACWCKIDAPCHASVLLDLANSTSLAKDTPQ
ncbi:MAG: hypothetical protein JWR85_3606 [Marmoricola sp.]|nr:hypothetical protein [Marmoricola sp.]